MIVNPLDGQKNQVDSRTLSRWKIYELRGAIRFVVGSMREDTYLEMETTITFLLGQLGAKL
ncbi:MAG: hypothetical protein ACE5R6_10365 [Candidatus Heimdallarchaeota archaeon]